MNKEINYEIDNCITDLDTLIILDKRAIKDVENNTHEIEQQEVLTIIREFIRLKNDYNKEKEKNKKLEDELMEKELIIDGMKENRRIAIEEIQEHYYISKDKIKKALGIEEDITDEKILNYIDTLVSENNRLEDIEDKKVQIEYQNVFNKGVKSVEDKIREKIKELEKEYQIYVGREYSKIDELIAKIKILKELLEKIGDNIMSNELKDIKEILELAKEELESDNENTTAILDLQDLKSLRTLYDLYEKNIKENTDLKSLYLRIAKHQKEIGHTELANYMLAQIQAIPTFTTWEDYTTWVSKDKIREKIKYYEELLKTNPKDEEILRHIIQALNEILEESEE